MKKVDFFFSALSIDPSPLIIPSSPVNTTFAPTAGFCQQCLYDSGLVQSGKLELSILQFFTTISLLLSFYTTLLIPLLYQKTSLLDQRVVFVHCKNRMKINTE